MMPMMATTITTLEGFIEPIYIRTAPTKDGWSNTFVVTSTTTGYTVGSGGKDGGALTVVSGGGATNNFNDAIIFINGSFTQWPEGMQQ